MAPQSLLIDTSTVAFQAGVLEGDQFLAFSLSKNDTLPGFFSLIAPLVGSFHLDEIIFCEGPGKVAGIRMALMFARIFRVAHPRVRIYSYGTLALIDKIRHALLPGEGGLVCVPKNATQFYILDGNRAKIRDYEALRSLKEPLHCLQTQHAPPPQRELNFFKYNLGSHGAALRQIMTPNETVETAYDPQNEYQKWQPTPRKIL